MDKLCMCNKINICPFERCGHRQPHEMRGVCEMHCDRLNINARCVLINKGFNPEEIILKSFGSTNG